MIYLALHPYKSNMKWSKCDPITYLHAYLVHIPFVREKGLNSDNIIDLVVEEIIRLENLQCTSVNMIYLKQIVKNFISKLKIKLAKNNRMFERLLKKESKESAWMQEEIEMKQDS